MLGRHMAAESARRGRPVAPIPKATISAWENSHRYPEPWYAYVLCETLRVTPDALALEPVLTPAAVAEIENSMARKRRPGEDGALGAWIEDLTIDPVTDLERLSFGLLGMGRIDEVAFIDLRRLTDRVIALRGEISSRLVLIQLHTHLQTLERLIHSAPVGRQPQLALLAAETAAEAAHVWYGMLDFGEAKTMCEHARQLGRAFDLPMAGIMGYASESLLYANRLHGEDEGLPGGAAAALELLRAAEKEARKGVPNNVDMWVHSLSAWHEAAAGNEAASRRHLERAERSNSQMVAAPTGFFAPWDGTYLRVSQGKTEAMLGDPRAAVDHFRVAVADVGGWFRPICQVQLAAAQSQSGEPEAAAGTLLDVLDRGWERSDHLVLGRVHRLLARELADHGDVAALRQVRERLGAR
ncbi:MAG TPA: hypothetical protein VIA06_17440 [Candidatus Dormibacteraeota bacterium]|jgi:hypothetical protein|nr:hypothetical protein [Candidatus Dormibacteraeota bacterium]